MNSLNLGCNYITEEMILVERTLYDRWLFSVNHITDSEGMLSEGLKINSTLTTLNLEGDYQNDWHIVMKIMLYGTWMHSGNSIGAEMIGEALKMNSALTALHLGSEYTKEVLWKESKNVYGTE